MFSDERLANIGIGETPPYSKSILLESSRIRLELLSDTIFITMPIKNVYSIGDVLLGLGVVIFGLEALYRVYLRRKYQPGVLRYKCVGILYSIPGIFAGLRGVVQRDGQKFHREGGAAAR